MIDFVSVVEGDIRVLNTDVGRAANLLRVQLGSLEYAPDWGVDLDYFLSESFDFQNESFRAYLVQRLAENGIGLSSGVQEQIQNLFEVMVFNIDDSKSESTGLIAR